MGGEDALEKQEELPRIPDIRALKAEIETLAPNAHISIETSKGAIKGQLNFVSGDYRAFGMKIEGGDLDGAQVECLLEGGLTGAVPEGVDVNRCFRISTTLPDGTKLSEEWSAEIRNLTVLG
jgi:hypothetical protein